ncbi:hypothetical protein CSUI_007199, partial [Cystoisospora suis]
MQRKEEKGCFVSLSFQSQMLSNYDPKERKKRREREMSHLHYHSGKEREEEKEEEEGVSFVLSLLISRCVDDDDRESRNK